MKFTKIATKFKQEFPIIVRITLGIVVVMSIHFVMIAKHYHHRYLLPVSLIGVGAVILFIFFISSISPHFNTKTYSKPFLGYVLSFVLLIFMFFYNKSFFFAKLSDSSGKSSK